MTYRVLSLALLALAFTSCGEGSDESSPLPDGTKDVSIMIQSSEIEGRFIASEEEGRIASATVVLFDKAGKYIDSKEINSSGISAGCAFTGVESALFPVSVFVVANVADTWEFTVNPTWTSMTMTDLDQLVVQHQFSDKTVVKGDTPLPMCARVISPNGGNLSVTLQRLVSLVSLANNSGMNFDHVEFTNLNSGVKLTSPAVPITANGGFALQETSLTFASGTTRKYYFMPTTAAEVTLKVKSGALEKSATLNPIVGNTNHPVSITSDNIDLNITIQPPTDWDDDNEVIIK